MYQLCFCILWAHGPSRDCAWERINSGAVEVRAEEKMTSLRQSARNLHHACQASPSITHMLLLVHTNSVEKVIRTEQLHPTANTFPTSKSRTETRAVNLGLWRARGRVCRSLFRPTFSSLWKILGLSAVFQCAQGHPGFWAAYLHLFFFFKLIN